VKEGPGFGRSPRGRSRLSGRALLPYCPSHRRCASSHVVPAGTNMGRMQHYFPDSRGPRCPLARNYETNPRPARPRMPHRCPDSCGLGARKNLRNEPKGYPPPFLVCPRRPPDSRRSGCMLAKKLRNEPNGGHCGSRKAGQGIYRCAGRTNILRSPCIRASATVQCYSRNSGQSFIVRLGHAR